jgi:hypothetical protein
MTNSTHSFGCVDSTLCLEAPDSAPLRNYAWRSEPAKSPTPMNLGQNYLNLRLQSVYIPNCAFIANIIFIPEDSYRCFENDGRQPCPNIAFQAKLSVQVFSPP